MTAYIVHVRWDEAAVVWSTNGEGIPGLFCESATLEELIDGIGDITPSLLHDNLAVPSGQSVDIVVLAERQIQCIAATKTALEQPDYSALSDDELRPIYNAAQKEVMRRRRAQARRIPA